LSITLLGDITCAWLKRYKPTLADIKETDVLPTKFKPKITSKRWKPEAEEEILKTWFDEDLYAFDPNSGKEIFTIDTPPPYLSGPMHVGQVVHYTQIDEIARYRRMQLGFNTYDDEGSYRTDSPKYRAVTQATFIDIWNKGLVYNGIRPNNWCFECGTTIADAEVEYSERPTTLHYLYFQVDGLDPIEIATTRPELLCACGAIFIHPEDKRHRSYVGKKAKVPVFGHEVQIIESPTAQMDVGTGALMVCSYGDQADIAAFRDYALEPIAAISPDGTMTEAAGEYAGLTVSEARMRVIEALMKGKFLFKQEESVQRVPLCWRSRTPIEFIAMEEYYVKQVEFIDDLMKITNETPFFPNFHRQILIDWLNRVSVDWPVSRRRYYGTELPIWYCNACGEAVLPESGEIRYYQPWKEDPPFKKCPKCGAEKGFRGEERTFDTWMDSSISGLQAIGYLRDDNLFKKAFGNVLRPQGKDIVRTWLYYSLLRIYQLTGKPAFKEIWVSGFVVDENGEAMSKSRGNSPPPMPFVEKYGADAIRFFGVLEAGLGSDIRFSEDRLAGVSKFMTKLWNIARFISMFPVAEKMRFADLTPVDQWVLAEANKTVEKILPDCDLLDFHKPAIEIRRFAWNFFADHVLEMLKGRCFNGESTFTEKEQKSAWFALHETLKIILKALAPITPFITDRVYRELYDSKGIHRKAYPSPQEEWISEMTEHTGLLMQTNAAFWKFKRESGLSLRQGVPEAYVSDKLKQWARDLQAMHGIGTIDFGKPSGDGFVEVIIPETEEVIFVKPPPVEPK
jgi:valyl-tRNA synthetase